MPETDHGIVYPESTDHTRLWEHFQNLAESVDALFAIAPFIQSGRGNISAADKTGRLTVTFPQPFAAVPAVIGSASNNGWVVNPKSVTANGFQLDINHPSYTGSATVSVSWVALGTQAS